MTPPAIAAAPQPSSSDRGVSAEAPKVAASPAVLAARGLLATAVAAVESFFLDAAAPEPAAEGVGPIEIRPVVCVFGLAAGCGATVVARALARGVRREGPRWSRGRGLRSSAWRDSPRNACGDGARPSVGGRSWRRSAGGRPALSGRRRRPGPSGGHRPVPRAGRHRRRLRCDRRCAGIGGGPVGDRHQPRRGARAGAGRRGVHRPDRPPADCGPQPGAARPARALRAPELAARRTPRARGPGGAWRARPRDRRAGRPAWRRSREEASGGVRRPGVAHDARRHRARARGRAAPVRVRQRARREGTAPASRRSRGDQRRPGDARPLPASVRAAVPLTGRAEPAPSGRGRVPRGRRRRRRQGRAAERGPRPGGGRELRRKRLRRDQGDRAGTRGGTRGARSPRPLRAGTARADPGSRPGDRRALTGGRWGVSRPGERRWVWRPARLPAGRADAAGRRARFRPHGGGRAR